MANLLVLLSDQLRRQALGIHGDPDARTPHLDAFAQQGVRFDNACSTYPICVPFRFTLMTGEYAHVRKIPGIEYAMSTEERTLADEFNEAGYETIYCGQMASRWRARAVGICCAGQPHASAAFSAGSLAKVVWF